VTGLGGGRIAALLVGASLVLAGSVHLDHRAIAVATSPARPSTTSLVLATTSATTAAPATTAPAPARPAPAAAPPANVPLDPDGVMRKVAPTLDGAPTVALTFDDGPDPTWTPRVLATLRDAGVHATFCMVGLWVVRYPDLARAVAADGHVLCDHTVNHDEGLTRRPAAVVDAQLRGCADDLERVVGKRPAFYRAPGGHLNPLIIDTAHRMGMQVLGWSDDPKDWRMPPAAAISNSILWNVRPGAIVLMHDGGGDRSRTVFQLPSLISRLKAMGYRFVTP